MNSIIIKNNNDLFNKITEMNREIEYGLVNFFKTNQLSLNISTFCNY